MTSSFLSHIMSDADPKETFKLSRTTDITDFPGEPIFNEIKALYKSKKLEHQITACLVNASITTKTPVFFLSKKMLSDLVASDSNLKRKSLNTQECRKFFVFVRFDKKILQENQPSTSRTATEKGKAGVYEISHPQIVEYIDKLNGAGIREIARQNAKKSWESGSFVDSDPMQNSHIDDFNTSAQNDEVLPPTLPLDPPPAASPSALPLDPARVNVNVSVNVSGSNTTTDEKNEDVAAPSSLQSRLKNFAAALSESHLRNLASQKRSVEVKTASGTETHFLTGIPGLCVPAKIINDPYLNYETFRRNVLNFLIHSYYEFINLLEIPDGDSVVNKLRKSLAKVPAFGVMLDESLVNTALAMFYPNKNSPKVSAIYSECSEAIALLNGRSLDLIVELAGPDLDHYRATPQIYSIGEPSKDLVNFDNVLEYSKA